MKDVYLISQARSGSTVTVKLLGACGYPIVSEPLVSAVEGPLRFRSYLSEAEVSSAQFLANPYLQFRRYRKWLLKQLGSKVVGLDLKFEQLALVNGIWSCIDRPRILQGAIDDGIRIVHLVRRNVFAQYISTVRARRTGIWHLDAGGSEIRVQDGKEVVADAPSVPPDPIVIDPVECSAFLENSLRRTNAVRTWCRDGADYHEIAYEDLYDRQGMITTSGRSTLAVLFGVSVDREPPLRRINSADFIANHDEIVRHFVGTPYAAMVSETV